MAAGTQPTQPTGGMTVSPWLDKKQFEREQARKDREQRMKEVAGVADIRRKDIESGTKRQSGALASADASLKAQLERRISVGQATAKTQADTQNTQFSNSLKLQESLAANRNKSMELQGKMQALAQQQPATVDIAALLAEHPNVTGPDMIKERYQKGGWAQWFFDWFSEANNRATARRQGQPYQNNLMEQLQAQAKQRNQRAMAMIQLQAQTQQKQLSDTFARKQWAMGQEADMLENQRGGIIDQQRLAAQYGEGGGTVSNIPGTVKGRDLFGYLANDSTNTPITEKDANRDYAATRDRRGKLVSATPVVSGAFTIATVVDDTSETGWSKGIYNKQGQRVAKIKGVASPSSGTTYEIRGERPRLVEGTDGKFYVVQQPYSSTRGPITPGTPQQGPPAMAAAQEIAGVTRKITASEREAKKGAESALMSLEIMKQELGYSVDEEGNVVMTDPEKLIYSAIPGQIGARTYTTASEEIADILTRIRTGAALNNQEMIFYKKRVPQALDLTEPRNIRIKFMLLENLFDGVVRGMDPDEIRRKAREIAGDYPVAPKKSPAEIKGKGRRERYDPVSRKFVVVQ